MGVLQDTRVCKDDLKLLIYFDPKDEISFLLLIYNFDALIKLFGKYKKDLHIKHSAPTQIHNALKAALNFKIRLTLKCHNELGL